MEPNLDLNLSFLPKTISVFLKDVSDTKDTSLKLSMLDDFLHKLEDEITKVDAFKRELPLCMLLLNDAIARLKDEKINCLRMQDPPRVAEQLMPLKTDYQQNEQQQHKQEDFCDMKNWMRSAQLWSSTQTQLEKDDDRFVPENPNKKRYNKNNQNGGAMMSFNGNTGSQFPSFSLSHSNSKSGCGGGGGGGGGGSSSASSSLLRAEIQSQPQPLQQNPRKERRCWSPELHRRFVDALEKLGGAQVATPKQIREQMQVDGLTNDEVKSHLQKYRLHVRRRFPVSQISQTEIRVFLMPQDEFGDDDDGDKSKGNLSSLSGGSPQGPLTPLLLGGSVKGLSSPGRNSMDAEDEQSDCRNWKTGIQDQQHHHEDYNHSL